MKIPERHLNQIAGIIFELERMAEHTADAMQAEIMIEAAFYLTVMETNADDELEEIAA